MTLEQMTIAQVTAEPGATCARLCRVLSERFAPRVIKGSSLSSVLNKLVKRGVLTCRPMGPRGGAGYFLNSISADVQQQIV